MQQILDEVFKAEEEADRRLQAARQEAERIKSEADATASKIIADARVDAQRLMREAIETSRAAEQAKSKRTLAEARAESDGFMQARRAAVTELVRKIVELVVTPEFRRKP